ncbi:survival motor neuron protein isoform X2 [Melitaea cinxia]|nr:survival motor neuron protein isoform X2 [Melitaea cinxia]
MAEDNILYVKGMKLSESDKGDDESDDVWDDSKLKDAYDRALKIANAEVARRVALSTNNSKADGKPTTKSTNGIRNPKKDFKPRWKAGMNCRAVYETDGVEYEALLERIINDDECVVRFLGYENSEIVSISSLKPSLGKAERTHQIQDALAEKIDNIDSQSNNSYNVERMECCDRPQSPGSSVSFQKKKKSGKKKSKQKQMNTFELPNPPTPNFASIRNIGAMDMPIPPPLVMSSGFEDEALSSMLLSWYMSGYYTGLYQGMKR